MKHHNHPHRRILGIALSTRGIGYAVLEGERLAESGVKQARGDKNAVSITKVKDLISHYQPTVVALEDASAKDSRRSPRIRKLTDRLVELFAQHRIRSVLLSQEQVRKVFYAQGAEGSHHDIAAILSRKYPEDLADRLPPKRRLWESEDHRMDQFKAVALALALYLNKKQG
jgi:RNase H-fold protein (predicted Holliday junction resolvase)